MHAGELPLFPLLAVLFPGTRMALRVFEPRYLDLVRRCLKNDEQFGIVAIREGSEVGDAVPYHVGTLARIVDWNTTPDGLLGLSVRGGHRFKIGGVTRASDGLYLGRNVERLDEPAVKVTARSDWAARLLGAILAEQPGACGDSDESRLDDANFVCWNLAMLLPLELEERQAVLELDDVYRRLERLKLGAEALLDDTDTTE